MLIYSIYGFQIAVYARELSLKNDKGTSRNGGASALLRCGLYATNFGFDFSVSTDSVLTKARLRSMSGILLRIKSLEQNVN
jgi:hypothetical protein